MKKAWWIIGAAVAAVLLIGGILALALGHSGSSPTGQPAASNGVAGSGTSGGTTTTASQSANPPGGTSTNPAPNNAVGVKLPSSVTVTAGSSNGKGGVTKKTITIKPVTDKAKALVKVSGVPTSTIAFPDAQQFTNGAKYAVTFTPWAIAPDGVSVLVGVTASKPIGSVAKPISLAGNLIVLGTRKLPAKQAVTTGGLYTGTVQLVREDGQAADKPGVLIPYLIAAQKS